MGQKDHTRTERWIANAMGWEDRVLIGFGGSNVMYEGDRIYSYGRHFELGRVLRTAKGAPRAIILNGDRYSATTTQHQAATRAAAKSSLLPTIIVPYRALTAASIMLDSIEPVDVRDDRTETFYHSQTETPKGEEVAHFVLNPETNEWGYGDPNPNCRYLRPGRRGTIAEWNPESENWCWETTRHWLGDSLFRAQSNGRKRRFLSSFDYQEARPLYFLCELPRSSSADTVEQAYEDLKPKQVVDAEAQGREVTRQGDMFAIPTELSTRDLKQRHTPWGKGRAVKRPKRGVLGTNHTATEVIFATGGRVYARGTLYHDPGRWREPDHARRRMGDGKTWHLLVKNTVPVSEPAPTRTRETV